MILLTGASGLVGTPLLERLTDEGTAVRCLVRDPRRLGPLRVRVQIALGDLADPPSFRNAMRGVDTVIHLAAAIRDQPQGSIEELAAIATWRMVDAARRAGAGRFIFFSALGASTQSRSRFLRAKALAEAAVSEAPLRAITFAPSIIYAPGDPFLALLTRLAAVPGLTPVMGSAQATFQPIWVADVVECVLAALRDETTSGSVRYELAGPQTLTYQQIVELVLASQGRRPRMLHIPTPLVMRALKVLERVAGTRAFATADEAELMEVPLVSERGTLDAERLGVEPRAMADVLGRLTA
ncbi:MAG: NAD(P)H-binding protein [Solirubrobacteraceae bacterium]|jgi:NADH dehydrogenase